jgi:SAM-dependent methyltransferase
MMGEESLRWRVVRPLFELLYTNRTLYWAASTLPFAGKWRTWQRLVIPRLWGHDVLEVGCGPGTLLVDLLTAGYRCHAIDRSPQMVAATRRRLHRVGHDSAVVRRADVLHLPFAEASFDTVVSTFPTEYIADPRALAEIARVLRPGGRLIVVLGATLLPANLALVPFVAVQRLVYGRSAPSPTAATHAGETPFAQMLRSVGLTPREEIVRAPSWKAVLYSGEKSA